MFAYNLEIIKCVKTSALSEKRYCIGTGIFEIYLST